MILLDPRKPYYKASLHGHTTCSDGVLTPSEAKDLYQKNGYSIMAFTDHEHLIDHADLTDEHFLALTACEIAIKQFKEQSTLINRSMHVCHLNLYAPRTDDVLTPCYEPFYDHYPCPGVRFDRTYERFYTPEGIRDIIRVCHERGFLVAYNHPFWSLDTSAEYRMAADADMVEIYNHSCQYGGMESHAVSVWDELLRQGHGLFATACDDFHGDGITQCDTCGGFVTVNAESLTYASVFKALKEGRFYASTGPQILSLEQNEKTVTVTASPARQIAFSTCGRHYGAVNALPGESVTKAEFSLAPDDGYFRITVTDGAGHKAWSQAYRVAGNI